MERVVILSARRYEFDDEKARRIEGTTVTYVADDPVDDAMVKGLAPLSISAPVAVFHQLQDVPGVYDIDLKMRPGKGGKATISLVGVQFVASVPSLLSGAV